MRSLAILVPLLAACLAPNISPQGTCAVEKPYGLLPASNRHFGAAVAAKDGRCVVGAAGGYLGGRPVRGSAQVLERVGNDVVVTHSFLPPGILPGDLYGATVAYDGSDCMVAARRHSNSTGGVGAVFAFRLVGNAWGPAQTLVGNGGDYGSSIAVSGGRAAVGAPYDEVGGAVYVYERFGEDWGLGIQVLAASRPEDLFGNAVALDGDTLLVSAPYREVGGVRNAGSLYVFGYDGAKWTEAQVLSAPTLQKEANFGLAVALQGDRLVVGAPGQSDLSGPGVGRVFVYERDPITSIWSLAATIGPNLALASLFGASVSLHDEHLVVGAPGERQGAVRIYEHDGGTWALQDRTTAVYTYPNAAYGKSVALDGSDLWVGCPGDEDNGERAGAVYLRDMNLAMCPNLVAFPADVSIGQQGAQHFMLQAGAVHAGEFFLMMGSAAGTTPGISVQGIQLPLNPDGYFLQTLGSPGSPPLIGGFGVLNGRGRAELDFVVPPGSAQSLVGLTLHHAYAAFRLAPFRVTLGSSAEPVLLGF